MKRLLLLTCLLCSSAHAQSINGGGGGTPANVDGLVSTGVVNKKISATASNTIYSTGTVTYSAGTYTAIAGAQPIPTILTAGQTYFVNFPSSNPTAASLVIGAMATKPIKVINSAGVALTLIGGEITPGPAMVYYDGTEYVYQGSAGSRSLPITVGTTLTAANFANRDTLILTTAAETLTLPCAGTLSPNGQFFTFSNVGAITITASACAPVNAVWLNGVTSLTQTINQGAALIAVTTDGVSNFYVSGGLPSNGGILSGPILSRTYIYNAPTTGTTVTIADTQDTAILEPAGTIATLTLKLPTCSAAYDGKIARFSSTKIVTTLTVSATAGTVVDAPATIAAGGGQSYECIGSSAKWYRMY